MDVDAHGTIVVAKKPHFGIGASIANMPCMKTDAGERSKSCQTSRYSHVGTDVKVRSCGVWDLELVPAFLFMTETMLNNEWFR